MKTKFIVGALLSTSLMIAQTNDVKTETKKSATVRIKKVENINGVEKVTDTTYTTTDPEMMKFEDIRFDQKGNEHTKKVVIVNTDSDKPMTEDEKNLMIHNMMKEMGDINRAETEKLAEQMVKDNKDGKICIKKTVIINVEMTEPNDKELKKIERENGETDGKLNIKQLVFFPSPSNGQSVTLSFELSEKGDAVVNVLNMEGKSVYTEKLNNFSGKYKKTIDISNNAKGVYFLRVEQGDHAQVKKIVLE